jgi:hypothetical protein
MHALFEKGQIIAVLTISLLLRIHLLNFCIEPHQAKAGGNRSPRIMYKMGVTWYWFFIYHEHIKAVFVLSYAK